MHAPSTTRSRTVLVTAPGFDVEGRSTGAALRRNRLLIERAEASRRTPEELQRLTRRAVAVIASADPFTAEVIAAAPDLRVIARLGVGLDSIDLEAATYAGVVVTTTPGLNDETCADHALALLLAASRRVVEHDASVRQGAWDRGGGLTPWDLHAKRVGVIGYGRIGKAVVRRLRGFDTEIRVFDPAAEPGSDLACDSLEALLRWVDILTIHVPLTDATAGLIGAAQLAMMKPSAIVVNTSRGGVINERAILTALAGGSLRAAAIDVFAEEPPRDPAWRQLANVVLSPHIGGLSVEAIEAMASKCVEQVLDVLAGRVPDGVANPDVLPRSHSTRRLPG